MQPHLEEAWRALQLADRDITAFHILNQEPEAHLSIVCFHAQQAVEKSLKAVLYSRRIEFRRIHDLTELTQLLRQHGIETPLADDLLARLNPFAVTFRYDNMDIELLTREDAAMWVRDIHRWAEEQVRAAEESEQSPDTDKA
jgi:HEPN domain-containing protein